MKRLYLTAWQIALLIVVTIATTFFEFRGAVPQKSIQVLAPGASQVIVSFTPNPFRNERQVILSSQAVGNSFDIKISAFGISRFQIEVVGSSGQVIQAKFVDNNVPLQLRKLKGELVKYECWSSESFFDFKLLGWFLARSLIVSIFVLFGLISLFQMIAPLFLFVEKGMSRFLLSTNQFLSRYQDSSILKLEFKMAIVICIYFLIYLIASATHFHGSSVGILGERFGAPESDNGLIFGEFRSIRSDEWVVHTPWLLSQENTEPSFQVENPNVGGMKSTILTNLPAHDFFTIFNPQFASYLILSGESAFCFYWNYKIMALLLGSFLLFLILSRNQFWIAWPLSIAFSYSSFIMWWFASNLTMAEMTSSWCFLIISFIYFFHSKSKVKAVVAAISTVYFFWCFVLVFYPPFQIPLVYVGVATILGFFLDQRKNLPGGHSSFKFKVFLSAMFVMVLILGILLFSMGPSMQAVMNLDYPGRRISAGGDVALYKLFFEFFAPVFSEHNLPAVLGNICEMSQFILFFPAVALLLLIARIKGALISKTQIFQLTVCFFLSYWAVAGLPPLIAKLSLLDRVPGSRSGMGIGTASFISLLNFLSFKNEKGDSRAGAYIVFILSVIGIAFLARSLFDVTKGQVPLFLLAAWLVLLAILLGLLVSRKVIAFSLILGSAMFCFNFTVNPVVHGISFLKTSQLLKWAEEKKDKTWLVFASSAIPAQFLKISGAKVLGGVDYMPNPDQVRAIDPSQKFRVEMNRYAHILFRKITPEQTLLVSNQSADGYTVSLPFSRENITRMGVDYIVYDQEDSGMNSDQGFHLWHRLGRLVIYERDK